MTSYFEPNCNEKILQENVFHVLAGKTREEFDARWFFLFRPPFWSGSTDLIFFRFWVPIELLYQWFEFQWKNPMVKWFPERTKSWVHVDPLYTNGRTQDLIHLTVNIDAIFLLLSIIISEITVQTSLCIVHLCLLHPSLR